ncbi:hypothetical protein EDB85DRAFT_2173781 [Lactarius pseudohatsudake]|nr:hypothetical protein EDB85DRAFT_2173781 [Lactarius pseudohatsudake]
MYKYCPHGKLPYAHSAQWDYSWCLARSRALNRQFIFLGVARWRTHNGVIGYFVDIPTWPSRYYPVEFNFDHICWAKVAWNPPLQRWDVNRPAGSEFCCDINRREIPSREDWGRLDGQETPSSQAAPEAASESETDTEEDESEEDHLSNVNPEEQEELARLTAAVTIHERPDVPAESSSLPEPEDIYIHEPEDMATATIAEAHTEEQPLLPINPNTGHCTQKKIWRSIKPWAWIKMTRPVEEGGGWPPDDGLQGGGGGPPRGPRGGGFGFGRPPVGFGGGPPGGWPPVGGPPVRPAAPPPGGNSKFVGQPPEVFTGDRTKTEEFLTQWELYWGINNNNTVMSNPYQRAMIFLTYIQGSGVNEWLVAISQWLNRQVSQEGVLDTNPWLWTQVLITFNRRFADTLEKECAQATLKKGIKMRDGDIDALPKELFEKCYQWDSPRTYEDWKRSVLHQQEQWIHMKARQQAFSSSPTTPSQRNSGPPPPPYQGRSRGWMPPRGPPPDPNAMDTLAGCTRGRLAGSEDVNPNARRPRRRGSDFPTRAKPVPAGTTNWQHATYDDPFPPFLPAISDSLSHSHNIQQVSSFVISPTGIAPRQDDNDAHIFVSQFHKHRLAIRSCVSCCLCSALACPHRWQCCLLSHSSSTGGPSQAICASLPHFTSPSKSLLFGPGLGILKYDNDHADEATSSTPSTRQPQRPQRPWRLGGHGEATMATTMATGYDYGHTDKATTTTATGDHEEMVRLRDNNGGNRPEATDDYSNGGAMATAEDAEAAEAESCSCRGDDNATRQR